MSLRLRLVTLVGLIIAVLAVVGVIVVNEHRHVLVSTLDENLARALGDTAFAALDIPPSNPVTPTLIPDGSEGLPQPVETAIGEFDEPIVIDTTLSDAIVGKSVVPYSDIIVARVGSDGALRNVTQGEFASDNPNFAELALDDTTTARFTTIGGVKSGEEFRVLVTRTTDGDWLLAARPLAEIESAVRQLSTSLSIGVAVVAALLMLLVWWVSRLGIRPIERVTEAAHAVSEGNVLLRVPSGPAGTEANRLSAAFNSMVDRRNKAESALRQFVADASHELRTPLTSFEGLLELIRTEGISADQFPDIIQRLRKESLRMRDLVENLLLLANLDQGLPMRREDVDLRTVARDAVSDFSIIHPGRSISFEDRTAKREIPTGQRDNFIVVGDELKLHQVCAGLIKNALSHTPSSSTIVVSVEALEDVVRLSVSDDGPGIDPALHDSVFDRFVRADHSRARVEDTGGFGLGLPIARSIIENLGGTLELTSEPGQGAEFSIIMPRGAQQDPVAEPTEELNRWRTPRDS